MREQARDFALEAGRLRAQAENMVRAPLTLLPGAYHAGKDERSRRRIVAMLEDWGRCSTGQIADHLALTQARVRACLAQLEKEGRVKRTGLGGGTMYALPSDEGPAIRPGSSAKNMIRDAARTLDVFSYDEIKAEVAVLSDASLRKWLPQLVSDGTLQEELLDGKRKVYAYATPHRTGTTHTAARPRQPLPEAVVIEHARRSPAPVVGTGRGRRAGASIVTALLREVRSLNSELADAGIEIEIVKTAHSFTFRKEGIVVASCSLTPGASSLSDTRRDLRAAGVPVKT
ncbi:MAG TPA: winged helix-turn-helix domain-containing protein [Solirubrobacteraceae bacterium]|nr:winged helix-turn-helix domain-containing protein [Solirubrobacteraceae bacterium]